MTIASGAHLHHGDCRLIDEGGATTTDNFFCQITKERFDQVQLTQTHVTC